MKNFKRMKRNGRRIWWQSLWLIIPGIFLITGFLGFIDTGTDQMDKRDVIRNTYGVYPVEFPEELEFAGEKVPLDYFDIRESLDRELLVNTYFHSQTFQYIKKSPRFLPVIESILAGYGIPEDFKYMPLVESGLSNAVSPAGAVGFWQLMDGTAREYGLEVNSEVDERYHLEKSTVAACKYLLKSYEKYGNWTMVAASFNSGRRGVDREIARQKEENYYDLLLNEETARYIFRILALKLVLSDPEKYGFYYRASDLYQPLQSYEIKIDSAVTSFADFAQQFNTNYKILKFLNPWLREPYLSNIKGKTYVLKIPEYGARIWNNADGINTGE